MHTIEYDLRAHNSLRLALLSDTHGVVNPGIAALVKECDIALHAGDIVGAGPLKALSPKLEQVIAVRGNNDFPYTWAASAHQQLAEIPSIARVHLAGGEIVMEHSDRVYHSDFNRIHQALKQDYAEARLVVYGHTHVRHLDFTSQPWLANPGAAGNTRTYGGASCLTLTTKGDHWQIDEHIFPV